MKNIEMDIIRRYTANELTEEQADALLVENKETPMFCCDDGKTSLAFTDAEKKNGTAGYLFTGFGDFPDKVELVDGKLTEANRMNENCKYILITAGKVFNINGIDLIERK